MKEMLYILRQFEEESGMLPKISIRHNGENFLEARPPCQYYENHISYRNPEGKHITRFDCGYSKAAPGYSVIKRKKREYIFIYLLSGTAFYNGKIMKPGDAVFVEPYFCNSVVNSQTDVPIILWCSWDGDIVVYIAQQLQKYKSEDIYHLGYESYLPPLFEQAIYNRNYETIDVRKYIAGFTDMLLAYLKQAFDEKEEAIASHILVKQAQAKIDREYASLTVEKLAKSLYVDSKYLSRLFGEQLHTTPKKYITGVKLTYAEHYLSNSDYPIQKISEMVGYNNYTNFYVAFRRAFNMSPEEYRRLYYGSSENK